MLSQLPAAMLTEWMAYDGLDPIGDDRADLQAGIVAAAVSNPYRERGAKPFKPADFMPAFDRQADPEPDDWLGQMMIFRALTAGR